MLMQRRAHDDQNIYGGILFSVLRSRICFCFTIPIWPISNAHCANTQFLFGRRYSRCWWWCLFFLEKRTHIMCAIVCLCCGRALTILFFTACLFLAQPISVYKNKTCIESSSSSELRHSVRETHISLSATILRTSQSSYAMYTIYLKW